MVDKVNGKAVAGEFLGKDLDFYSVALTADLDTSEDTTLGYATGTITFSTAAPVDGDTVVIGGDVITFRTTADEAGEVARGASHTAAATNLDAYINANVATLGVTSTVAGGVVTVKAVVRGTDGNAITLAETATANIEVSGANLTGGSLAEVTRTAAAVKRVERIFETIGLNGQPIIIGAIPASTGAQTLKFALEHKASWQDGETLLAADTARTSLDTALEAIPGVTSVTVTKTQTI